jgi:hypothetical protein
MQPPRGLSAAANHQIRCFERSRGLLPGHVAIALHRWAGWGRCRREDRGNYGWRFSPPFADDRALLEVLLATLRRPARRQLLSILKPLDDRFRALTANDPFAPKDAPWWQQRSEL